MSDLPTTALGPIGGAAAEASNESSSSSVNLIDDISSPSSEDLWPRIRDRSRSTDTEASEESLSNSVNLIHGNSSSSSEDLWPRIRDGSRFTSAIEIREEYESRLADIAGATPLSPSIEASSDILRSPMELDVTNLMEVGYTADDGDDSPGSDEDGRPLTVLPPLSPTDVGALIRAENIFSFISTSEKEEEEEYDSRKNLIERRGAQIWKRYRQDHPRAFKHKRNTVSQSFPYFNLPLELRRVVLRFQLKNRKEVQQMPLKKQTHNLRFIPVDTRVFAVSQKMKEEAEEVFYSENKLRIDICEGKALPLWITSPPAAAKEARYVNLWTDHSTEESLPILELLLRSIGETLGQCRKLTYLRISQSDNIMSTAELFAMNFNTALEGLRTMKDVAEVIIRQKHEKALIVRLIGMSELLDSGESGR